MLRCVQWRLLGREGRHCLEVELISCFDELTMEATGGHAERQEARSTPRPWHRATSESSMFKVGNTSVLKFQIERDMKLVYKRLEKARGSGEGACVDCTFIIYFILSYD